MPRPEGQPAALLNLTTAPEGGLATQDVDKFQVILVRPGIGGKKYHVPPGTTVDDLLKAAEADAANGDLMIGDQKVGKEHVLSPNTLLFVVPKPKNAGDPVELWQWFPEQSFELGQVKHSW